MDRNAGLFTDFNLKCKKIILLYSKSVIFHYSIVFDIFSLIPCSDCLIRFMFLVKEKVIMRLCLVMY